MLTFLQFCCGEYTIFLYSVDGFSNKQHHLEPVTMTVHPTMRGGSCTGSHSCSSQQLTNSASISGSRTVTDSASVVQLQLEKNSSTHTGEILCTVRNALASKLSCLPVDADIADNVCTPTCEQTCFSIFPLSSHHRSSAISHTKVVAIGNVDHSVSCIPETFTHEPHPPSTKKPQRLWTCSADKFHRIFKNHGESATWMRDSFCIHQCFLLYLLKLYFPDKFHDN